MTWITACAAHDLPPGEARRLDCEPPVAVYNVGGEFFATDDLCTHGNSSLAEGYVEDDATVECAAHMARFCLRSGKPLSPPAVVPLRVFATAVREGVVFVDHEVEGGDDSHGTA